MVLGGRDSKGELTCCWFRRLQTENGPGREEQTEEKEKCLEGVSGARLVWARSGEQWSGVAELSLVSRVNLDDGGGEPLTGDYLVGQVADSLAPRGRPSRGSPGWLATLFSSVESQLRPVYVPVSKVSHRVLLRTAH